MAEIIDSQKRYAFSGWPMIILWAGIFVFSFHACTHMVAAGDTWVALTCGRHSLNHGVDTVEPFSANTHKAGPTGETMSAYARLLRRSFSGKSGIKASVANWWADRADNFEQWPGWLQSFAKWFHPTGWINQNWGTHYLFFWLAKTFGTDGNYNYDALIYWKFIVTLVGAIATYYLARVIGVCPLLAAVAASFAPFVGRTFIDVRPAVFSNMLTPILILVFALATYRNIRYIWLVVPVTVFWCNVHGGYLYVFMVGVLFVGMHFITVPSSRYICLVVPVTVFLATLLGVVPLKVFIAGQLFGVVHLITINFSRRFINIGKTGVLHTIAAGFAAFIAMIIFNPFHLTNLTHTFIITLSEHAKSWRNVNEWHPAFEWSNRVGHETAFLVMYIIAWLVLVLWLLARFLKPKLTAKHARQIIDTASGQYEWPKIDLPLITIAAFTVYMAVRSRRFIPIAASTACPVMALFIQQTICMIAARIQLARYRQLTVPPMPKILSKSLLILTAAAVVFFGYFWGAQFKQVYLDPWPVDGKYDSVFMRMTASNVKPTDVGRFIRENKLSGRTFNYWTEGGAIAFAQEPDPETGRTPLRLFMDGRAQAAYDHDKFQLWNYIKRGGPAAENARLARRKLTADDYTKIGKWIDQQMKKYNVWVILMPFNELNSTFLKALKKNKNWATVYADTYQRMFIDTDTPKGKALISDVLNQRAKFPNELSKNLTLGGILIGASDPRLSQAGCEYLKKALEIRPSQISIMELINAARRKNLRNSASAGIKEYFERFSKSKGAWSKEGGYEKRLTAAIMAAKYLAQISRANPELSKQYTKLAAEYIKEQPRISKNSRW